MLLLLSLLYYYISIAYFCYLPYFLAFLQEASHDMAEKLRFQALPGTLHFLASTCDVPAQRMERLLRALVELRMVDPPGDGARKWRLTERGELLTEGVKGGTGE